MAFWLARERRGQQSDWIQRFDPRFWTVDFPRPMMASVVTTGPDSLRVDCEFVEQGNLAGLIWESEDRLDHPLLAYATQRDYSHCTLQFRWRSQGLRPLDAVDGPTLTIEGRDAEGNERSWYVRLWNYAEGTPTDAVVTLPFSSLGSGWTLPGEPVAPGEIDRMFISLVDANYVEGSGTPFGTSRTGHVELSEISCDGERASIAIGDVFLPAHGESIATAYDDLYNQTPARLLRSVEALGYRGRIVHYVGMSHYYRIWPFQGGYHAARNGDLCEPAKAWHRDFFARAVETGFAPIVSLSYELLDQNCPSWFRQRTATGRWAMTGWDPPSSVLSPTNDQAMAFLKGVARNFILLLEGSGAAPLFQIGEPWWWVFPDTGAPCIFDPTVGSKIASRPLILSLRDPLDDAQKAFLDAAGEALAQSTIALADHVRAQVAGEAEVMLLVFTPTLLDPDMPEMERLNLPLSWAHPTFDRLQVEDYDWLTSGANGLRRSAYEKIDQRLGYPTSQTDYMAGFVLDPDDAERFWPPIDAALDEARGRGIANRFVWALPQVQRDGYTRLPFMEDDVQAFDDVAYPLALGRDASVAPEFSTTVAVTSSGYESRNALWSDARLRYDVGPGIRSEAELGELIAFFRARYGPARGFRLRDPFDHSSNGMTGEPGPEDQAIGTGNGADDRFRLAKSYGEQVRPITRPEPASIRVSIDGTETANWTLEPGGWIGFATPPPDGADIRAGFRFDVPVRFAEDRLDVSGLSFAAGEAPSVPLIEIREAS